MIQKCPGQDSRNLKVEIIRCPACGYKVEIFSDELRVRCPRCKRSVMRGKLPSCLDRCPYAKECMRGPDRYGSGERKQP